MLTALSDYGGLNREQMAQHAYYFNKKVVQQPEEEGTDLQNWTNNRRRLRQTDSNMESEMISPATQWAYDTIETIKEAITEREGHVNREVVNELTGIYSDVLLVEINKLRSSIKRELYGDGNNNSIVELMNEIADIYNITVDQLELKTRKRQYLEPRQLFHWAMVNKVVKNSITLEQIGQLTGGHDHATVIHSNRQVKDRITTEREFREMVMKFCNKFGLRTHWTGNNIETTRVI